MSKRDVADEVSANVYDVLVSVVPFGTADTYGGVEFSWEYDVFKCDKPYHEWNHKRLWRDVAADLRTLAQRAGSYMQKAE